MIISKTKTCVRCKQEKQYDEYKLLQTRLFISNLNNKDRVNSTQIDAHEYCVDKLFAASNDCKPTTQKDSDNTCRIDSSGVVKKDGCESCDHEQRCVKEEAAICSKCDKRMILRTQLVDDDTLNTKGKT